MSETPERTGAVRTFITAITDVLRPRAPRRSTYVAPRLGLASRSHR
ncbi:hypothetical protein ITJ43_09240 [Microbacterium sp. VKM Ac-2870]|nr:hypothetical protein [Microbacterium sp. VKM Ac-2870]MBF4562324.1 hypothetical protein [Microbacterium sp. VKM Ac-2870]